MLSSKATSSSLLSMYSGSNKRTTNYKALTTIFLFQCIIFHAIVPDIAHSQIQQQRQQAQQQAQIQQQLQQQINQVQQQVQQIIQQGQNGNQQQLIKIDLLNAATSPGIGSQLASMLSNSISQMSPFPQSSSSSSSISSTTAASPESQWSESHLQQLFHSHQEEYDPWKFDPKSFYGTPYGGYGRATKSRLASLPLRLISNFNSYDDNDDEGGGEESSSSLSSTYFTMRDGDGRQFACRVYNDHELQYDTLLDSMFDIAQEKDSLVYSEPSDSFPSENDLVTMDDNDIDGGEIEFEIDITTGLPTEITTKSPNDESGFINGEGNSDSFDHTESDPFADVGAEYEIETESEGHHQQEPQQDDQVSSATSTSSTGIGSTKSEATATATATKDEQSKQTLQHDVASKILDNLNGVCAQYHKDWWSYEWCHGHGIVQFHIAMSGTTANSNLNVNANSGKTNSDSNGNSNGESNMGVTGVEIEGYTSLGSFFSREIIYHTADATADDKNGETKQSNAVDEDEVEDSDSKEEKGFGSDDDDDDDDDLFEDDYYDNENDIKEKEMQSSTSQSITSQPPSTGPSESKSESKHDEITSIEIIDKFVNGEYCPAAKKKREVTVHISCCDKSQEIQELYNQYALLMNSNSGKATLGASYNGGEKDPRSEEVKKAPVLFHKIEEHNTCEYTATICTTLVCSSMVNKLMAKGNSGVSSNEDSMGSSSKSNTNDGHTDSDRSKKSRRVVNSSPSNNDFSSPGSASEIDVGKNGDVFESKQIFIHRDDSIRDILDKALGVKCLSMNAGWWTYGFCHKTQIFQFHEDTSLDPVTAKANTKIEARYLLGKYDKKSSEEFPVEEEIKHMHRPYDKGNSENDDIDDDSSDTTKANLKSRKTSNGNAGMADAYFAQEYLHGDTCEGSDVVDSAIKGGKFGDGKIERSTTVRFFCGSQKAIIRVNEDSTCHYVMDISMPELCVQKHFEVPHLQTQVVKCLPVN